MKNNNNNIENKDNNNIIICKYLNNSYIHNTKDCILNNNDEKYNFDYIKCDKCKYNYCIYCYSIFMKSNLFENNDNVFYNNKNEYLIKFPYDKIYKCYGCNNNIPFIIKKSFFDKIKKKLTNV